MKKLFKLPKQDCQKLFDALSHEEARKLNGGQSESYNPGIKPIDAPNKYDIKISPGTFGGSFRM